MRFPLLDLCEGNPLVTSGFPLQMDSNAKDLVFSLLLSHTSCWRTVMLLVISDGITFMWLHCDFFPPSSSISLMDIGICIIAIDRFLHFVCSSAQSCRQPIPLFSWWGEGSWPLITDGLKVASLDIHHSLDSMVPVYRASHWGHDKITDISQMTFWNAFSWMKMHEFRQKWHWILFLRVQLTISRHWFR